MINAHYVAYLIHYEYKTIDNIAEYYDCSTKDIKEALKEAGYYYAGSSRKWTHSDESVFDEGLKELRKTTALTFDQKVSMIENFLIKYSANDFMKDIIYPNRAEKEAALKKELLALRSDTPLAQSEMAKIRAMLFWYEESRPILTRATTQNIYESISVLPRSIGKIRKTFALDRQIANAFGEWCDERNLKMSDVLEVAIRDTMERYNKPPLSANKSTQIRI